MMIQELTRQDRILHSVGVKLIWIEFGSSRLKDGDRQEDLHLDLFIAYLFCHHQNQKQMESVTSWANTSMSDRTHILHSFHYTPKFIV